MSKLRYAQLPNGCMEWVRWKGEALRLMICMERLVRSDANSFWRPHRYWQPHPDNPNILIRRDA